MVAPVHTTKGRASPYPWSEAEAIHLFEAVNDYQLTQGLGETIVWNEVLHFFRLRSDAPIELSVIKNKFDNEKKVWRLWNSFRGTLTNAQVDPQTNQVIADEFWWTNKLAQNPHFRTFRRGVPSLRLTFLMDTVYSRIPSCQADLFAPVNMNAPENDPPSDQGAIKGGSMSNPSIGALNDAFFDHYEDLNNTPRTPVDNVIPVPFTRLELGSGSGSAGSKGRESARRRGRSPVSPKSPASLYSAEFQKIRNYYTARMEAVKKRGDVVLDQVFSQIIASNATGSSRGTWGMAEALAVLSDMVRESVLDEGSQVWCFAISVLKDPALRTAFVMMEDHDLRMTWLQFEFDRAPLPPPRR